MERKDVIRKIEKLMAIAGDAAASDQEIQLATYRANKLMLEYKINNFDFIKENSNSLDVEEIKLSQKGIGYFIWILNIVCKGYQCRCSYNGKINSNLCCFYLYGLKNDIEMLLPVAEGLLYYLNNNIEDLKYCYIGRTDFRVFKRNYFDGFSEGLRNAMEKSILEIKDYEKYELMITSIPVPVEELYKSKVKVVEGHFFQTKDSNGYDLGKKHGLEYDIKQTNLIGGNG